MKKEELRKGSDDHNTHAYFRNMVLLIIIAEPIKGVPKLCPVCVTSVEEL